MKKIFRTVWAVYGALIFFLEALLYAPLYFLFTTFGSKKTKQAFFKKSYYYVPRVHFIPCFIKLKVTGDEKIDRSRQYVIVSNHQSILDIYANPGSCPVFFKFLSKSEVQDIPILGRIADSYCVFVDRKSSESRKRSYMNMKRAIQEGYSILIYPEGTRNRSDQPLKSFHDGAFKLAIETGTPIAVQTLVNSSRLASPLRIFDLAPGTIYCHWDEPIETGELLPGDIDILKEKVKNTMLQHLDGSYQAAGFQA